MTKAQLIQELQLQIWIADDYKKACYKYWDMRKDVLRGIVEEQILGGIVRVSEMEQRNRVAIGWYAITEFREYVSELQRRISWESRPDGIAMWGRKKPLCEYFGPM